MVAVKDLEERSILDILLDMKDSSELMVSLAYASVLFSDAELAEEVLSMEEEIDELEYELAVKAIMAGRGLEDARQLASIIQIGIAADEISNSAAEIAYLVKRGMEIPDIVKKAFLSSDERISRVTIKEGSQFTGLTIAQIDNPEALSGCEIIALKRHNKWILDIPEDLNLRAGDVLLLEGTVDGLEEVIKKAGEKRSLARIVKAADEETESLKSRLLTLKSLSELTVHLAYSCLMFNSKPIAREVEALEEEIDQLHLDFETYTLSKYLGHETPEGMVTILRVALSAENIADAAYRMAKLVLDEIVPHPVFREVIEVSEETVARFTVSSSSIIAGRKIGEIDLEEKTGMGIIAVKRGSKWIYSPKPSLKIKAGDILLMVGPHEGEKIASEIVEGKTT